MIHTDNFGFSASPRNSQAARDALNHRSRWKRIEFDTSRHANSAVRPEVESAATVREGHDARRSSNRFTGDRRSVWNDFHVLYLSRKKMGEKKTKKKKERTENALNPGPTAAVSERETTRCLASFVNCKLCKRLRNRREFEDVPACPITGLRMFVRL
ncbi:hypothetical protein WN55_08884 [Dufourea novaeangliae]|uniref:Uncharacterized protein n=1 Tax=Dufourea novaeangliae TaxID=178035 RepID=A0A154P799_DUFNO|nr:hypothetical protein WN55_08884 [Dufourea novaeangliae]